MNSNLLVYNAIDIIISDRLMESIVNRRKKAYSYMCNVASRLNWIPPIDSDARLADVLDVPIGDIISLKEGKSNTTSKMITSFKKLVCPLVSESEVDHFLVKPFVDVK